MGELVELDVTTVEESVTVNVTEEGAVQISVVAETGPAGPAGPNSVTSATTSDGTAELKVESLEAGSRDGLPILNSDGDEVAVIGRDNSIDGESGTITGVQFGSQTEASGNHSFAHGAGTVASGDYSHASGSNVEAQGAYSSASGVSSLASGLASNAEGEFTIASGNYSKAIGSNTTASGLISFAGGVTSTASGDYSYAYGTNAKAIHDGASVESDSEAADVESTTTDEKTFRFANGYRFLGGAVTIDDTLNCDHIHGNLAGSVYAHIRAGENLAKGDPVYISGSHGSGANLIAIVSKADAANAATMPAVGVMDAAVSNNANGHMVITGTITELNTNAYPINTVLYVATGGGWTSTPPAANSQAVAIVERSNTNNGAVIVKVNGLGSSGGNGAADANKLARYSTAGTLPIAIIGGLGTGVGTFLATPTSANLALALTDENGTGGGFVRAEGATLTSPSIAGTAAFTGALRPTSNALNPTMADGSLIARQDFTRDFTSFYIRNQMAWEAGPWVTTGTGPRNTIDGNNLGGMRIIGTTQLASASSLGAGIKYPDGAFTGQTMIRFSAVWHARLLIQNYFSLNSAVAFIFGVRNMAGFWSNSSIGLYHVPQPTNSWAATNVYAVGDRINVSGIVQIVSTAGISGASEPAFNATRNGTTSDGTVTWRNLGPHTSNKWALGLVDAAGAITLVDTGVSWVSINTATTLLSIRSDGTSVFASVNASTEVSVARGSLSAAHPYILARQDIVGAGEISGLLFTFEKPLQF